MESLNAQQSQEVEPASAPTRRTGFGPRRATMILLILTLGAAVIRFTRIDHPPLWQDEARTFWRVCGSYRQLLAVLQYDGFGPLHYEFYWLLGQALGNPARLTPFWMRLLPALAGTAMIPAMYLLARQFLLRGPSLVVAAFTACSAYMVAYSRDAKMYMPLWLFCALSMACFLCWLRTRKRLAWMLWVAATMAAAGFHASGLAMLLLQLLSIPAFGWIGWRRMGAFVLGTLLILTGPAGYYYGFSRWAMQVRSEGWNASGLAWIGSPLRGRDPVPLLRGTASAYLCNWEWPNRAPRPPAPKAEGEGVRLGIDPRVFAALTVAITVVGGLALCGLFPWNALTVRKKRSSQSGLSPGRMWVLLVWLTLPAYACYCFSAADPPDPWDWVLSLPGYLGDWWMVAALAVPVFLWGGLWWLCFAESNQERWRKARHLIFLIVALHLAGMLIVEAVIAVRQLLPSAGNVWMPRYLGFIWPAFAMVACGLLMRLPGGPVRWMAVGLLLALNLGQCIAKIAIESSAPIDRMIADLLTAERSGDAVRTYLVDGLPRHEDSVYGSVGKYYSSVQTGEVFSDPSAFLERPLASKLRVQGASSADEARANAAAHTHTQTLIVWDRPLPGRAALDRPHDQAHGTWVLRDERYIAVRQPWDWATVYWLRRMEFTRAR